ncbi:FAD/NAD(P)-binding domain-containing protein [Epithele typhae]|uniref:FAD/NAD(P)-binding domain-containing protein n=1 Tax=Epithele typhae TaxID=378194 RepID=UPI002007C8FF|nr:FAD/NAD(P)-binding domain-containing protein [Epithele typhae]KAH9941620.1 FAD/NAD(P)-binding domain-containing protein [Epithele typhae]
MGSSSSSHNADATSGGQKHICIIGLGPVGLGALKTVKDAPQFKDGTWRVTAFEGRDNIGGIWYPAPADEDPPLTALYDSLTTNTPHPFMCYSSMLYSPGTPIYCPATTVLQYIYDFSARFDLEPHIKLSTRVTSVHWNQASSRWDVTVEGPAGKETIPFDLILVSNGHFRVPRFPQTPSLATWISQGKATHTAFYRRPETYRGKLLVVGGAYSGQDVAAETRPFASAIIHSITDATPKDLDGGKFKIRGRVAEYLDPAEGKIVFEDGSTESGVDHVVVATGYQFNFPFLSEPEVTPTTPVPVPPLPAALHNTTYHLFPLAKHMFPLVTSYPPSSLAFLGLPLRVAPFPLAEVQARAALQVFADPSTLDIAHETEVVRARHATFLAEHGGDVRAAADAWFRFGFEEMFDYRDELYEFVGDPYRIPQAERRLFEEKDFLREQWRAIERDGEAEEWLRGVGAGEDPVQEWEDHMWKVYKRTVPSSE